MSELSKLEREIRQLEVAIYDLKTENNLLHEALDQVIEDRDSYHEENAALRKDLDEATHLNQAVSMLAGLPRADEMEYLMKDKERLEWLMSMVGWASTRDDIDRMRGEDDEHS